MFSLFCDSYTHMQWKLLYKKTITCSQWRVKIEANSTLVRFHYQKSSFDVINLQTIERKKIEKLFAYILLIMNRLWRDREAYKENRRKADFLRPQRMPNATVVVKQFLIYFGNVFCANFSFCFKAVRSFVVLGFFEKNIFMRQLHMKSEE